MIQHTAYFPKQRQLTTTGVIVHDALNPIRIHGSVIHGFGRGSKLLGTPTANIPPEPYTDLLKVLPNGVFYGWAALGRSMSDNNDDKNERVSVNGVYEAVMSIGWNPVFKNEKKSIEAYLMHDFAHDFYGEELKIMILGFIRLEADFESIGTLKKQINHDLLVAKEALKADHCRSARFSEWLRHNEQ